MGSGSVPGGWEEVEEPGFIKLVGPIWRRWQAGSIRLGFIAEERHLNIRGAVQGGMVATLLDRAIAVNVAETIEHRPQATLELSVYYVDALQAGEFVEVAGRVEAKKGSLLFGSGDANVEGRLIATARGVWKILKARTEPEEG